MKKKTIIKVFGSIALILSLSMIVIFMQSKNNNAEDELINEEIRTVEYKNFYSGETNVETVVNAAAYSYQNSYGVYSGSIQNGKRNGKGTFTWNDGSEYTGAWKDDCIHGKGEYVSASDVVFDGEFYYNEFVEGTVFYDDSGNEYTLYVDYGEIEKVEILYKSGNIYTGKIKGNKVSGKGKMWYKNGDVYKGYFKNGKRSGTGKYTWDNGATYKGKWKKDKMNGKGKFTYKKSSKGSWLEGKFKNNKPSGVCVYKAKSGKKYKTYWSKGKCKKVKGY